jgi:hypothetical protein
MSPVPRGVYSILDPDENGVEYTIMHRGVPAGSRPAVRNDTIRGVTYRMSLEGLPLGRDSAAVALDANFSVKEEGDYLFTIAQGDPVTLSVDGSPAVTNERENWWDIPSGMFHLSEGAHAISVTVAATGPAPSMDIEVRGPGIGLQPVPPSMLRRRE